MGNQRKGWKASPHSHYGEKAISEQVRYRQRGQMWGCFSLQLAWWVGSGLVRNRSWAEQQGQFCYCNMAATIGGDRVGKEGSLQTALNPLPSLWISWGVSEERLMSRKMTRKLCQRYMGNEILRISHVAYMAQRETRSSTEDCDQEQGTHTEGETETKARR